jgi:hypothetical protein
MAKQAAIIALIVGACLAASACGLSAEERLRLSLNGEVIPPVFYEVYKGTGERQDTILFEITYDRASGSISGPFRRFVVPTAGSKDIVQALSGEGGEDELMLFFSANKYWDTDLHGFWFTRAERLQTREEKGKTIVSMRLKPLDQIPMDELRGRNEMIWYSGTLLQAAATLRQSGVLGTAGMYSPFWVVRNPSRKRANVVLLDDGKSLDQLLYVAGAKSREETDF